MRVLRRLLLPLLILAAAGGGYYLYTRPPTSLVLTGIVTTREVALASQIGGRVVSLGAKEGDVVHKGQVLAEIDSGELAADRAYYEHSAEGLVSQVAEDEAAVRLQRRQLDEQVRQAEASIATAEAEHAAAQADLERASITLKRTRELANTGVAPAQQLDEARTGQQAAEARVASLARQADAARAALALAQANAEQVSMRLSQVATTRHQLAALGAQKDKAQVRLDYTHLAAPADGIVDVAPVRQGEVVTAGQTLLTIIDQDDLWVRADVEETYLDRVKVGSVYTVRLPSGEERQGTVFYRRADASFATQRDVSRTKRDIKTFEIRLRVDNADRALAVGMTVYVLLPLSGA